MLPARLCESVANYSVGVVVSGAVVFMLFSSAGVQPTIPTRMAARAARSVNFFISY